MKSWTLEEAIALGRGVERPFKCFKHEDTTASASVNVIKNVWVCYACRAGGVVDSNRVPTHDELMAMLEPEEACRTYPSSWLDVYGHGGYWLDRFPDWLCWLHSLGEDPWTGEATFPVHTPGGRLAGVGKRSVMSGPGPRYRYPAVWSASRTLFGSRGRWSPQPIIMLGEGAADGAAGWQIGVPSFGTFGAGLHKPQIELVAAMNPKLILLGFDMDDAGDRATRQSEDLLAGIAEIAAIDWGSYKDPAECPPEERLERVLKTVGTTTYGLDGFEDVCHDVVRSLKSAYVEEVSVG